MSLGQAMAACRPRSGYWRDQHGVDIEALTTIMASIAGGYRGGCGVATVTMYDWQSDTR
jgi:hypothetical protein